MAYSLTVSIVNTNQWLWLEPCLRSVLENPYTLGGFELVVLDNASDDDSVRRLREEFPTVRIVAERVRRGFGVNHGLVASAADSDLIMFLNPDTLVPKGSLDRLAEAFDVDDRVVAVGGPIINPNGAMWRAAPFTFPSPWRAWREALGLHRLEKPRIASEGISVAVGWLSGSALMVDRRVFLALGGFDPRFFLYFEESDFAKRLTEAGGRIAFHSDAPIVHEGWTTERAERASRPSSPEMKTITEYEHFGRNGAIVYRGAALLGAGGRLLATYVPALARHMEIHGGTVESTRRHHRRRLGLALNPSGGVSIGDAAAAWNTRRAQGNL
jgi:GT2 family glycosyltransferase